MQLELEQKLNYQFQDKTLLTLALTHRSFARVNNERLEFLGDAMLSAIIAEYLYLDSEGYSEGTLSQARAMLVNKQQLAKIAEQIDLMDYLVLGACEQHNDANKHAAILADALEAILAAIYLDGGLASLRRVILALFAESLAEIIASGVPRHPKTALQEWTQAHGHKLPVYQVVQQTGPSHACSFIVECKINAIDFKAKGVGGSKQLAEEAAAKQFLAHLRRVNS